MTPEQTMTNISARDSGLRHTLIERRRALQDSVDRRTRDGRTGRLAVKGDDLEQSDAGVQGDVELALLQMRAEMLTRIDEALRRLDAGQYGSCFECADEISDRRLRALPFAVRCQACEERREHDQRRARQHDQQRGGLSLFMETVGS
jgi:DnaK suppressor protein